MNDKDLEILKLLLFDRRMPYESIAMKVKSTPYLVNKRINNLVDMGVIIKRICFTSRARLIGRLKKSCRLNKRC
ncbi:MAG: winged helix-turn-helix transcriptional regulator [Candidatus Hodarchaeota archaeon]